MKEQKCEECGMTKKAISITASDCVTPKGHVFAVPSQVTPQPDEWEDKKYREFIALSHEGYQVAANHEQVFEYKEKVKSFIRSTIQSAVEREREELVSKVEGMKINYKDEVKGAKAIHELQKDSYNQALSDVLLVLKGVV